MSDLVIVGNGPAAVAAIERFRSLDSRSRVTLVSKEEVPFYSPCPLAEYVEGSVARERLFLRPASFYDDHGVEFLAGATAVGLDRGALVISRAGAVHSIAWHKLLVATGAVAARPPIEGLEGTAGVFALKTLSDAEGIIALSQRARRAVVIGSGFIGLEAAQALRRLGLDVTLIEALDQVLPQMLDVDLAEIVRSRLEANGVKVLCSALVRAIESEHGAVRAVRLDTGVIAADLVVIATGVRPDLRWLAGSGIATDQGILVDASMATSVPGVWAAGDVAQAPAWDGRHRLIPTWPNAVSMGSIAGVSMAGGDTRHGGTDIVNVVRVFGMAVASFGERGNGESHDFAGAGARRRVLIRDGRISNGQFIGDISGSGALLEMMRKGVDVSRLGDKIARPGVGPAWSMPRPPKPGRHAA